MSIKLSLVKINLEDLVVIKEISFNYVTGAYIFL